MPLTFQTYPFSLGDLREWLAESLPIVEEGAVEQLSDSELEVVGPFPSYYLDARELVRSGAKTAERTGWRALVQINEEPLAIVEISLSTGGMPRYATRGKDAAAAFAEALRFVAETKTDADYEVRWLSLADIYVTALWLSGDEDLFVPTRLGSAERIAPRPMRLNELQTIVEELVRQSTSRRRPSVFFESLTDRFAKSPRSGLPDE